MRKKKLSIKKQNHSRLTPASTLDIGTQVLTTNFSFRRKKIPKNANTPKKNHQIFDKPNVVRYKFIHENEKEIVQSGNRHSLNFKSLKYYQNQIKQILS